MKKLLKNLTLVSTTALLLCITATTTTIPNIPTETEVMKTTETTPNNDKNKETELSPLSDKDRPDETENPLS